MTRYGTRALPWQYPWPSPCVVHLCYNLQPQLYTQDKRRTGRPIASTKNGVSRAQSGLRHYLTCTSSISLLPRHPSTHMQTTLHSYNSIEIGRRSSWLAQHCRTTLPRFPLGWNWTDNSPSNSTLTHYVAKWRQEITFYVVLLVYSGELTHVLRVRTGALALVYSAAEYAAPAWCRNTHVKKKLDVTLNDTLRIVNGCRRPTPVKYIPVLLGIAPPALRREHHTSTLIKKALLNTTHLLHARIATAQNLNRQRLRSRRPFSRQAASLTNSNFNLMEQWKHDWQETT